MPRKGQASPGNRRAARRQWGTPTLTPQIRQRIIDTYNEGMGAVAVAEKTGYRVEFVRRVLRDAGVMRTQSEAAYVRYGKVAPTTAEIEQRKAEVRGKK